MDKNREGWLTELGKMIEPVFKGFHLQKYRLTCGWPSHGGMAMKKRVIGECHGLESSTAGIFELFISPTIERPEQVAGVVVHEMTHVAAGVKCGHKQGFVKVCRHVGLTKGKPTQAMPGEQLAERLKKITDKLGEYPHKAMKPVLRSRDSSPKSMTLECALCGCKVSISYKWLEVAGGPPTCFCGGEMGVQ